MPRLATHFLEWVRRRWLILLSDLVDFTCGVGPDGGGKYHIGGSETGLDEARGEVCPAGCEPMRLAPRKLEPPHSFVHL